MNKDTTEKAFESHVGETQETLEKHQDMPWVIQTEFFQQRRMIRSFVQTFKTIRDNFSTSKIQVQKRKWQKATSTGEL